MEFGTRRVSYALQCFNLIDADLSLYDREEFLNAQYRFVMKPIGDYTVHFADPDMFVLSQTACDSLLTTSLASSNGRIFYKSSYLGNLLWLQLRVIMALLLPGRRA